MEINNTSSKQESPKITSSGSANSVLVRLAEQLKLDPAKLWKTLKATCFRPDRQGNEFSDEEAALVLMFAEQFQLNPLRREIWAFRNKRGIVEPIVSIDGWKAIMLRQPNFDGFQVTYSDSQVEIETDGIKTKLPEWCECTIWLKNVSHPTVERVFSSEVFMPKSPVWSKSPRLMLHHRALIQAIRFSFNVAGIADESALEDDWIEEEISSVSSAAAVPVVRKAPVKPLSFDKEKLKAVADKAISMARQQCSYAGAYAFAKQLDESSRQIVTDILRKAEEEDQRAMMEEEHMMAQRAVDAHRAELS